MEKIKILFNSLSYLKYPFLLLGLFYSFKPSLIESTEMWNDFNLSLTFMGIGISFSSLADISKASKVTKKLYKHKKFIRVYLIYLVLLILLIIGLGVYCIYFTDIKPLKELSIGLLVFGIGMISLLKMSVESIEFYNSI